MGSPSAPSHTAKRAPAEPFGSRSGSDHPALLGLVDGDAVRCVACAHRCLIRPGRAGICRVRGNRGGHLATIVYGKAVAANADPIEKKPLFHVYPGSVAFSIATMGCNFHCLHCQNWAISQAGRDGVTAQSFSLSPERVVAAALAAGSRSIAYTYTEPTVFIEYVLDTARLATQAGWPTFWSPMATRSPRLSTSWLRTSRPPTSTSSRSRIASTVASLARAWLRSWLRSLECAGAASGSR